MRCDCCPFGSDDDTCPEAEGKYGIEHKDGVLGCKHPRNWVEKWDRKHTDDLGDMGTDMGIEMTISKSDLKKIVELCKHTVGLDYKKPYHRHGKAFYKPYRNYYEGGENTLLNKLPSWIINKKPYDKVILYSLTSDGLKWLGRQLKITIKQEADNDT